MARLPINPENWPTFPKEMVWTTHCRACDVSWRSLLGAFDPTCKFCSRTGRTHKAYVCVTCGHIRPYIVIIGKTRPLTIPCPTCNPEEPS